MKFGRIKICTRKVVLRKHCLSGKQVLPGVVVHAFDLRTLKAEAGGSLNLRSSWSIYQAPGQHSKILSQKLAQLDNCIQ